MSTGLLALLDDVAALVKASAATLDDIPAQVARTSGKISGIVIDDTAVTPKYVVGLDPARELSVIYRIAKKSLFNKLLIVGPAALLLGFFAPWAMQPLLMLGGAYLCFEGYEKVHSLFVPHDTVAETTNLDVITPEELEKTRIAGAVRTDFILSAEIIAITYATVADKDIVTQIVIMFCVAVLITLAVYGFVVLIVKMDDIGVHLARDRYHSAIRATGRCIVRMMPGFLAVLGSIGTAAMLWVGAEIIAHGVPVLHHGLNDIQAAIAFSPALAWLVKAMMCAVGGVVLGACVTSALHLVKIIILSKQKRTSP